MKIVIDTVEGTLTSTSGETETRVGLYTREAFETISAQWVRVGWSLEYYRNFTWFGLPILQLPEDLVRIQEAIYRLKPRTIVETGIFHGGSLLYYASLLEALGEGRVIGIDRAIPPEVRSALESHSLRHRITLLEADSTDPATIEAVREMTAGASPTLVILDSGHTRDHVRRELDSYAPLVTPGSYIVATDGITRELTDVPGGCEEWTWDNPLAAATEFAAQHPEFAQEQPAWPCRKGPLEQNVTYWPGAWLKRIP